MSHKFFVTKTEYDDWLQNNYKLNIIHIDNLEHGIYVEYIKHTEKIKRNKRDRLWLKNLYI